MAEIKQKLILGYFEIDKNGAAMPALAGEEVPLDPLFEKWELDSNGDLMPKNGDTE